MHIELDVAMTFKRFLNFHKVRFGFPLCYVSFAAIQHSRFQGSLQKVIYPTKYMGIHHANVEVKKY